MFFSQNVHKTGGRGNKGGLFFKYERYVENKITIINTTLN